MDKLDMLFRFQFNLLNKYLDNHVTKRFDLYALLRNPDYINPTGLKQKLLTDACNFIAEEAFELKRCFNYKTWKPTFQPKVEEAREELIDIMHFVLQAAILLGMNSDDFLEAFEKKNLKNHKREDEGYNENH
jgi:dimeric dUTPase (all-alpha-NTP-PPase superfamily)